MSRLVVMVAFHRTLDTALEDVDILQAQHMYALLSESSLSMMVF